MGATPTLASVAVVEKGAAAPAAYQSATLAQMDLENIALQNMAATRMTAVDSELNTVHRQRIEAVTQLAAVQPAADVGSLTVVETLAGTELAMKAGTAKILVLGAAVNLATHVDDSVTLERQFAVHVVVTGDKRMAPETLADRHHDAGYALVESTLDARNADLSTLDEAKAVMLLEMFPEPTSEEDSLHDSHATKADSRSENNVETYWKIKARRHGDQSKV